MRIDVESLSSVKKKINFEIPADRVASEMEKVLGEIGKKAAIKGFRKGKVPRDIIRKHYKEKIEDDALKNLVNDTYFKALMDEKIYPVTHPVIDTDGLKEGEPLRYSAIVEVFPDVVVKDYTGLEVKKEKFVLNEEVVANRLREMQENMAHLQPAASGHITEKGDFVTIDFKGTVNGEPFEGGAAEDFQLEIGSGRFIPGFEDQLIGLKTGDEGEVKVTFPMDYGHKELAGKDSSFAVKIKEIKIKELPELNDDFAKDFGEFESLAELKEKIEEVYVLQEKDRIETELRERLMKALLEMNSFEVPDSLVDKQVDSMLESSKKRLAMQRMTLEMMGLNEENYRIQFRAVAETQVKGSLLLDALAKQEDISVPEADVDERYQQIAEQNRQEVKSVRTYYEGNSRAKENLIAQLKEDKALDFLLAKANVKEVDKADI